MAESENKLIAEAREEIDRVAGSLPGYMANKMRLGESEDTRMSLIVRLLTALESRPVVSTPPEDDEQKFKCRWCNGDIRSDQFMALAEDTAQRAALSLHEDGCKSRPVDARFNYEGNQS